MDSERHVQPKTPLWRLIMGGVGGNLCGGISTTAQGPVHGRIKINCTREKSVRAKCVLPISRL